MNETIYYCIILEDKNKADIRAEEEVITTGLASENKREQKSSHNNKKHLT